MLENIKYFIYKVEVWLIDWSILFQIQYKKIGD